MPRSKYFVIHDVMPRFLHNYREHVTPIMVETFFWQKTFSKENI